MALVLTSNVIDTSLNVDEDDIPQKPYLYRNYLKETLTLPKDSEVAVQSVKFSRDDTATLNGDKWYQMYNINLQKLDDGRTSKDTTGYPIVCSLGTKYGENMSVDKLADGITVEMRRGYPHPDVWGKKVNDDVTPICKLLYDGGSDEKFDGFTFRATNYGSAEDINNAGDLEKPTKMLQDEEEITLIWNKATQTVTAPVPQPSMPIADNVIQLTDYPISLFKGNMRVDIEGVCHAGLGVSANCAFGLCRAFSRDGGAVAWGTGVRPEYFRMTGAHNAGGRIDSLGDVGNYQYFDYGIRIGSLRSGSQDSDKFLSIVCPGPRQVHEDETVMKEIEYYGWGSIYPGVEAKFTERYNMTTNSLNINQFLIRTEGEQVLFYYHTGALSTSDNPLDDAGWTLFCGYKMGYGYYTNANNKNLPNPICQTRWMMYPQFYIGEWMTGGAADDRGSLKLSAYSGRTGEDSEPGGYNYFDEDTDWWARCVTEGIVDFCQEVDCRRKFNDPWRIVDTTLYTQPSFQGARQTSGYCWAMCLLPDDEYYIEDIDADVDELFGFKDVKILQPDEYGSAYDGSSGWRYDSQDIPELLSDASLFIRLDNYTQKTLNSAVGRPSKVLYMCPRFDASSRSNGDGLYFEPHERVYVKLNNPHPLTINEFDISICNIGEVLAKDLKGQTIVNLHFRENQTGFRQQEFLKKEKDEGVFFQ